MTSDRHEIPLSEAPRRGATQAHAHQHDHAAPRAVALGPTWSLMRLSALQRLAGALMIVAILWALLGRLAGWL
jgi:hypothetical protein